MKQTIIKNVLVEMIDTHLSFTNPVAVLLDRRTPNKMFFAHPLESIGTATLEKRSDGIYATMRLNLTGNAVKGLFPNVGYVPRKQQISGNDSKLIEGEIVTINISRFKNKDNNIPSIKLN